MFSIACSIERRKLEQYFTQAFIIKMIIITMRLKNF